MPVRASDTELAAAAQAGFLGGLFFLDVGRARRGTSAVPFVFLAACLFAAALLAGSAW